MGIEDELPNPPYVPSTEKDSPYCGRDPATLSPAERIMHEKYKSGQVRTFTPEAMEQMNKEINADMQRFHREFIRKMQASEEAAKHIYLD